MTFTLQPALGKDFVDREEFILEMVKTLKDKRQRAGFALYGKRRMGKTSLFMELKRRLEKTKWVIPVYFSLWNLMEGSAFEFISELTVSILDSYRNHLGLKHKAKKLLKLPMDFLKDIVRGLEINIKLQDEIEVLLNFKDKKTESLSRAIEMLFDLPERLAGETKTRCVLFLDEFPSIMELKNGKKIGEGAIRKIRTIMETRKNTILCISGSIRKTMETAALDSASPFYRQFIVREIQPLAKRDVIGLIKKNIKVVLSKDAQDAIFNFTSGIPFYVQFLGIELQKVKKSKISKNIIASLIELFLSQEGNLLFTEEFRRLSPKERKFAAIIAKEKINSISRLAEVSLENVGIVSRYLIYLENKGVIKKESDGTLDFEDPIFKMWLERKY